MEEEMVFLDTQDPRKKRKFTRDKRSLSLHNITKNATADKIMIYTFLPRTPLLPSRRGCEKSACPSFELGGLIRVFRTYKRAQKCF
jgi:hypothetical protein